MKKTFLITLPLLLPVAALAQTSTPMTSSATPAPVASPTAAKLSLMDTHFIKMAAISGMAEVNDGQLASTQGGTDAIKKMAAQMVADHTKANNQLMALAQQKGATAPTSVDAKHAAIHGKLTKLTGSAFDKEYLTTEYVGHVKTIALFKTEAATGSDPDLKAFATSTLPTLQQHLAMIKAAM